MQGDWVLFMRAGLPCLGIVICERKQERYPWQHELVTTSGTVTVSDVIESRPPRDAAKGEG